MNSWNKWGRDEREAKLVARIATRHLGLRFDDTALSGLPSSFRKLADRLDVCDDDTSAEW